MEYGWTIHATLQSNFAPPLNDLDLRSIIRIIIRIFFTDERAIDVTSNC